MEKTLEEYKDLLYKQFALIGKAVSSHKRLEVLDLLSQGERTVEELAKEIGASISSVSQHLQILKSARLVENRKNGLHVHYRLADDAVGDFWRTMRALAVDRLAELRETIRVNLDDKDKLEQVSHKELLERARRKDVVVLDVRPHAEYNSGHIPEALSIPLDELENRLGEIPNNREVVAYCRGPYCIMALVAVELLRQRGYQARRLEDGFPEWRAEGLPVIKSDNNSGKN
jgi:rhodanese-related sulfurtransferase/DNA-binding HxlR family transcriptional regulator